MALTDMSCTPRLYSEQDLWRTAGREIKTNGGMIDLTVPKSCAEFLASGYAYSQHSENKTYCDVTVQVGELLKTLSVSGERHWENRSPSHPAVFERISLDWQHTYGGKLSAKRDTGMGRHSENDQPHALPHIEYPHNRMSFPEDVIVPACFDALDIAQPHRLSKLGKTYDTSWLENDFPGFAQDMDWGFFNMAQADQQWVNRNSLPDSAAYRITNMHPTLPVQEGRLPSWRARSFVKILHGDKGCLEEIPMRPTTVWFLPHLEQMILIYQGCIETREDDAADISHLMVALEIRERPRPLRHYQRVLAKRCDKKTGALFSFRDSDLVPQSVLGPAVDATQKVRKTCDRNTSPPEHPLNAKYLEQLKTSGIDTAALFTEKGDIRLPSLDDLPDFIKRLDVFSAQLERSAPWQAPFSEKSSVTPASPEAMYNTGMASYRQQREQLTHCARDQPGLYCDKLQREGEASLRDAYCASAHLHPGATKLDNTEAARVRQEVKRRMLGDRDLSKMDLNGADLSGLDLRYANLSYALLDNTCLRDCQLDYVDLKEALLAHADLTHASLRYVNLHKTSLGSARCDQSDFSFAHFTGTNLENTTFSDCSFTGAVLDKLLLHKTRLSDCLFTEASITHTTFLELTLNNVSFQGARLYKNQFLTCEFMASGFNGARLEGCIMFETQASHTDFTSSTLTACAFVTGTQLQNVNLENSTLKQCNFRKMAMQGARFHRAKLENCDFSQARLSHADMRQLKGNGCTFNRCDLSQATLENSDLIGALMQKSYLTGTDLRGANVFRADMSQAHLGDAAQFNGAYVKQLKTFPRLGREEA